MENNIRKIRQEKGLTIIQLSKLSNTSKAYLYHLENGTRNNPSYDIMKNIAKSLGKEITDVFILWKLKKTIDNY